MLPIDEDDRMFDPNIMAQPVIDHNPIPRRQQLALLDSQGPFRGEKSLDLEEPGFDGWDAFLAHVDFPKFVLPVDNIPKTMEAARRAAFEPDPLGDFAQPIYRPSFQAFRLPTSDGQLDSEPLAALTEPVDRPPSQASAAPNAANTVADSSEPSVHSNMTTLTNELRQAVKKIKSVAHHQPNRKMAAANSGPSDGVVNSWPFAELSTVMITPSSTSASDLSKFSHCAYFDAIQTRRLSPRDYITSASSSDTALTSRSSGSSLGKFTSSASFNMTLCTAETDSPDTVPAIKTYASSSVGTLDCGVSVGVQAVVTSQEETVTNKDLAASQPDILALLSQIVEGQAKSHLEFESLKAELSRANFEIVALRSQLSVLEKRDAPFAPPVKPIIDPIKPIMDPIKPIMDSAKPIMDSVKSPPVPPAICIDVPVARSVSETSASEGVPGATELVPPPSPPLQPPAALKAPAIDDLPVDQPFGSRGMSAREALRLGQKDSEDERLRWQSERRSRQGKNVPKESNRPQPESSSLSSGFTSFVSALRPRGKPGSIPNKHLVDTSHTGISSLSLASTAIRP